jgi:hypothetical protein
MYKDGHELYLCRGPNRNNIHVEKILEITFIYKEVQIFTSS